MRILYTKTSGRTERHWGEGRGENEYSFLFRVKETSLQLLVKLISRCIEGRSLGEVSQWGLLKQSAPHLASSSAPVPPRTLEARLSQALAHAQPVASSASTALLLALRQTSQGTLCFSKQRNMKIC